MVRVIIKDTIFTLPHREEAKNYVLILGKLTIPQAVLVQLNEELKASSNQEHAQQMQEIAKLKSLFHKAGKFTGIWLLGFGEGKNGLKS